MLKIAGFIIDAELEASHDDSAEITSHPIEVGSTFSDHIFTLPKEITITGVVSNTPIGDVAEQRGAIIRPSEAALAHLEAIYQDKEPITIETSLKVFDNMMMVGLSIPTGAEIGDVLEFEATFVQVTLVSNQRTTIPVTVPEAAVKTRRGTGQAKRVQQPETQPSEIIARDEAGDEVARVPVSDVDQKTGRVKFQEPGDAYQWDGVPAPSSTVQLFDSDSAAAADREGRNLFLGL